MIRRIIVLLVLVMVAFWALGRFLAALRGTASPGPAHRGPTRRALDGSMVRDRNCNTFVARESAVRALVDGQEQFFCSETCRDTWLAHR